MKSQVLMSDGSVAQGIVPINADGKVGFGDVSQAIGDTNSPAELAAMCGNFAGVSSADFVTRKSTSNGQVITALSMSPLIDDGESNIIIDTPVVQPAAMEIEASISQRVRHQISEISLFAFDDIGPPPLVDIEIASVYQCSADSGAAYNATVGTILTVVLKTPLPASVYLGDWIHSYGLVDNRLNYPNMAIKFISYDRKTITCGFSDDVALISTLVANITPPAGSAYIRFYSNASGAANGFGMRFSGTSATQAALFSIFGSPQNDAQVSGTLIGDQRVAAIASTAPIYANGIFGNVELRATSRYRLEARPHDCSWLDQSSDAAGLFTARATRTAVKPAIQAALRPRIRACRPKSMTRPVAKIASISKAGSTTATVNTQAPHGLKTGTWINIKGVRDQTNFANISTPVAVTVISPTRFTIVHGSSATATSYGGAVIITNGGVDQQGALAQIVNTASYNATDNILSLVGSASWSGVNVGDYVNLYGLGDNLTGADLGVDGAWEVALLSSTRLDLMPIYNVFGVRVSPPLTSLASTDCGGLVLLRTTLRAHDMMVEEWGETRTMIDGAGTQRLDRAIPARIVASDITQAVSGTVTATEGTPNAASAYSLVSTASTNGAVVKASGGNLFELSIFNATAATIYFKIYNKATAPTVGTDVPAITIPIAAGAAYVAEFGRFGKRLAAGIAIAITAAAAATDATVIGAGAQISATYL